MPRVDPNLMPVVVDLERGLRELGVPFGIVGALVPGFLLEVQLPRKTNDVDVAVVVEGLADFDLLKDGLADYGFTRTRRPHRLDHRNGGWADILPLNEAIARDGLELEDGVVLNMAGFGHVVPNAVPIVIEGGPTVPVAPLPLHVLLKLVAFSDREEAKDLAGALHCLKHYLEDDDRRTSKASSKGATRETRSRPTSACAPSASAHAAICRRNGVSCRPCRRPSASQRLRRLRRGRRDDPRPGRRPGQGA